jgi:Tfp pilus assembly protein PilX
MNTKWQSKTLDVDTGEKGVVLIAAIALMAVLALVGVVAAVITSTEIKISSNYNTSVQASYIARAGVEHARQKLKFLNEGSTDTDSFSDELANAASFDETLEGYTGDDDVPVVGTTDLGNGSYTVYLTNDSVDGSTNQTDTNRTVCLTSVATTSNGSKAIVEMTVSDFELFPLPATITMLGSGATFTGGNSIQKEFHGDDHDQCGGSDPYKPVIVLSDATEVSAMQEGIDTPSRYRTKSSRGNPVNLNSSPDEVVIDISQSEIDDIDSNYDINLLDPADLDDLVETIKGQADTVAPDGSTDATVDLGSTDDPKVVVVTGDFEMISNDIYHGAGILIVTGTLIFAGSPNYDGLILVIGEGAVVRNSDAGTLEDGIFNGAILVAKTTGGVLGASSYTTAGHGKGTIQYCSTAVDNAVDLLSFLKPVAVRDIR